MKQKASNKLHGRQCHDFFFTTIGIIPPFECDLVVSDIQNAVVGNCDPVGIPAKIVNHTG